MSVLITKSFCTAETLQARFAKALTATVCGLQTRSEDGKFSLSVDAEQQVVKLGTSMDLGFCGARKKVCMQVYMFSMHGCCMLFAPYFR